jgi:large subunit ribosomal protein L24
VQLITGASQKNGGDRGKTGKVIAVYPRPSGCWSRASTGSSGTPRSASSARGTRTGGIITQEAAVHISNVMLVDPETKKPTRVGVRAETVDRDGRQKTSRIRVASDRVRTI